MSPTAGAPRVLISRCLLGDLVRYDGRHKRDPFLVDVLGRHLCWEPVCPELEVGMGVPREPVSLVAAPGGPRMLAVSGREWTGPMRAFGRERPLPPDLCGAVLKSRSPSCALRDAPRRADPDEPTAVAEGPGLFAAALAARFPHLPLADEEDLRDPPRRRAFLERVFAEARLQALLRGEAEPSAFHARHRVQLLAHAPGAGRRLGRRLGDLEAYAAGFREALARPVPEARRARLAGIGGEEQTWRRPYPEACDPAE